MNDVNEAVTEKFVKDTSNAFENSAQTVMFSSAKDATQKAVSLSVIYSEGKLHFIRYEPDPRTP